MRFVSRGLANAGFTVYSVQLAGHCGSEEDLLHTNWHDWYASVEAAIARIAEKHDSIFMIGLSVGALLSLHYSAQNPGKIKGLGLMSMTLRYDGWSTPKLRWLLPLFLYTPMGGHYRFVENYPYGIKDERLRQRVVANMLSGNSAESGNLGMTGYSLRQLFSLVRTIKKELPKITTPSIVLHASNDDVASRWNADYVAGHLGGPCRKVLLDDCYHMITVDNDREQVATDTIRFFESARAQHHPG